MPVVTKEEKKKRKKQKEEGPKDVRTPAQVTAAKASGQAFIREREKLRSKEGLSAEEATKRITFREKERGKTSFEQVPVQQPEAAPVKEPAQEKGIGGKVTDVIAKFGLSAAAGKQLPLGAEKLLPAPDIAGAVQTPGGKALGLVSAGAEVAGAIVAGKFLFPAKTGADLVRTERTISRFAKRWKVPKTTAAKVAVKAGELSKSDVRAVLTTSGKRLKGIGGAALGFGLFSLGKEIAETNVMMTWMAIDNVISASSIFSRDTANRVKFGDITSEEGSAALDETQEYVDLAKDSATDWASKNPFLWAYKKQIDAAAEVGQLQIDANRLAIEGI